MLGPPGEVATFETESAILEVSATNTHGMDALRAKFGVGGLAAEFELSLLAVVCALGTGSGALVSRRT